MDEQKLRAFFRRISGRLAILLGGTVAFSNSAPLVASTTVPSSVSGTQQVVESGITRKMPTKLVLRKTSKGLKMIAQHSSHSSHASHASHASHSSHASHASHASHSSHSSRAI